MVRSGLLSLLLGGAGCGAASPAGGGAGGAETCWPIEAFRIDALEHGVEWEPVFEVSAAGEVVRSGREHDVVARFATTATAQTFTIERESDSPMVLTCGSDHVVTVAGKPYRVPYDERDELSEGDKIRIYVAPDGEVHQHMGDHVTFGPGGDGRARVVGNIERVRRTAEMVLFVAMGL